MTVTNSKGLNDEPWCIVTFTQKTVLTTVYIDTALSTVDVYMTCMSLQVTGMAEPSVTL